jgi:hypothetical protein
MRAWLDHATIGLCNGKDTSSDWERWRRELAMIAGAVEPFVMKGSELADRSQRG